MTKVEQSIEVNVPVSMVFNQLAQFEEFPRFMKGVHSVHQLDDTHLHWCAEKGGKEMEWDAEITELIPEQRIAWRNTNGPRNEGSVTFEALGPDKTRLSLSMDADEAILKHPEKRDSHIPEEDEDLARFKKMIEHQAQLGSISHAELAGGLLQDAGSQPKAYRNDGADDAIAFPNHASQQQDARHVQHPAMPEAQSTAGPAPGPAEFPQVFSAALADSAKEFSQGLQDALQRAFDQAPASVQAAQDRMPNTRSMQPGWPMLQMLPELLHAWEKSLVVLSNMGKDMDQLFRQWLDASGTLKSSRDASRTAAWSPAVEIEQQNGQLTILAELPGVKKEDVSVEIADGQLIIAGQRRPRAKHSAPVSRHTECQYGHCYRAIALPQGADPDSVRASMQDGILEVTLDMPATDHQRKQIPIQ